MRLYRRTKDATVVWVFKKIYIYLFVKSSPEKFAQYLRNKGMRIGKDVKFFYPRCESIDKTRPWLVEIGDNVQITKNVTILTHGYDWSVIKHKYGEICGSSGKVTIGNNVFIGFNATILKGVTVGNNVIIGANSLVNKNIPDNVVVAGNPAKVIMSIEDYYEKRKSEQYKEAKELVLEYYNVYKKVPDEELLREFVFLFKERKIDSQTPEYLKKEFRLLNNYQDTVDVFLTQKGMFNNYKEFIESCGLVFNQ